MFNDAPAGMACQFKLFISLLFIASSYEHVNESSGSTLKFLTGNIFLVQKYFFFVHHHILGTKWEVISCGIKKLFKNITGFNNNNVWKLLGYTFDHK